MLPAAFDSSWGSRGASSGSWRFVGRVIHDTKQTMGRHIRPFTVQCFTEISFRKDVIILFKLRKLKDKHFISAQINQISDPIHYYYMADVYFVEYMQV